jgi:hypothetical protein
VHTFVHAQFYSKTIRPYKNSVKHNNNMKPTVVLIPGAWHKASQYSPVTDRLKEARYEVHGIDYPSTGPNPTNTTFRPDIDMIQSTLSTLANAGKDIMIVCHSAGGILAGEAVRGFSKSERETAGKAGGVIHLCYIAAFAGPEGGSLWNACNGPLEWEHLEGQTSKCKRPKEIFYNLCDPELADKHASQLDLISTGLFSTKTTYAGWKHIPGTYLLCRNDMAIPAEAQEAMSTQPGAQFDVVRCDADHSPFLCMPEYTAKVIRYAAGEKINLD